MGLDTEAIDGVAFDSFSTLVDVESSREAIADYTETPEEVAHVWRRQAVFYSVLANFFHEYETYYDCHRMGLQYASELYDLGLSREEIETINEVYYDLEPFDDVKPVLRSLDEADYELSIISNGNPAMLDAMIETLGVEEFLSNVVSADEIKTFKPHAKLYRHAAERADTPVDRMVHVSAAVFDAQGARNAGMQGVWIDRTDQPMHPYGSPPNLVIDSLHTLADELGVG